MKFPIFLGKCQIDGNQSTNRFFGVVSFILKRFFAKGGIYPCLIIYHWGEKKYASTCQPHPQPDGRTGWIIRSHGRHHRNVVEGVLNLDRNPMDSMDSMDSMLGKKRIACGAGESSVRISPVNGLAILKTTSLKSSRNLLRQ